LLGRYGTTEELDQVEKNGPSLEASLYPSSWQRSPEVEAWVNAITMEGKGLPLPNLL
jgi:hypothetical protein